MTDYTTAKKALEALCEDFNLLAEACPRDVPMTLWLRDDSGNNAWFYFDDKCRLSVKIEWRYEIKECNIEYILDVVRNYFESCLLEYHNAMAAFGHPPRHEVHPESRVVESWEFPA